MPRRSTRRPPGRPCELENPSRFYVRLSGEDYQRLVEAAARSKLSKAAVLRWLLRRDLEPPTRPVPPIVESEERTEAILVRLTPQEKRELLELARGRGMAQAALVRLALRRFGMLSAEEAPPAVAEV